MLAGVRGNIKLLDGKIETAVQLYHRGGAPRIICSGKFSANFQPHGIKITNYYADTGEWHPATWFLSKEHRKLVKSEVERIKKYRAKGDLL